MTTLNVTWTNPTPASNQAPLAGVKVYLAVQAATPIFSLITTVAAPGASFTQTEIDPGSYIIRLVVVDTQQQSGLPVDTPFSVAFASPGQVTNVVVALA